MPRYCCDLKPCYRALKDGEEVPLSEPALLKKDLVQRKTSDISQEEVSCCRRWVVSHGQLEHPLGSPHHTHVLKYVLMCSLRVRLF